MPTAGVVFGITGQPLLLNGISIARDERPDSFTAVPKYGLTMLVTNDSGLQQYLGNVLKDVRSASRCRCRRPSPCHPLLSSSAGPLAHE